MNQKFYTKDLIREIAQRAGFTVGDVTMILETFEEIFKEIVVNQDQLIWGNLFKLRVSSIAEHEGYDAIHDKYIQIPKNFRVVIKSAPALLNLLRPKKQQSKK
jgi:hypothetical protein